MIPGEEEPIGPVEEDHVTSRVAWCFDDIELEVVTEVEVPRVEPLIWVLPKAPIERNGSVDSDQLPGEVRRSEQEQLLQLRLVRLPPWRLDGPQ